MPTIPTVSLNSGAELPQIGFGTARVDDEHIRVLVREALGMGYRLLDTAARYGNEVGVGQGIADAGLPREDVLVCTKLRGSDQGYASAKEALDGSLRRLGLDYVDLYLIHWPLPRLDAYIDSWRAMEEMVAAGKVRTIGVSNFAAEHLDRLAEQTSTVPALNQIELHPRFPQREQRADNARRGIVTESWSPLAQMSDMMSDPILAGIARQHGKSAVQVVLRWHVQQGLATIPKTTRVERLPENMDVFDFHLTDEDMAAIAGLDTGKRVNDQDPRTYEEF